MTLHYTESVALPEHDKEGIVKAMFDPTEIFKTVVSLFVIVDPVGNVPLFLNATVKWPASCQAYGRPHEPSEQAAPQ